MVHFHFCETFIKKIEGKDFEEIVRNKLSEISNRDSLKNSNTITCINGIYILKTSKPKTRTVIEEQNIEIDGDDVKVYFVRDVISNNNFDYDYVKVLVPHLRNRTWLKNNPLQIHDKKDFIEDYKSKKEESIQQLEYPPQEKVKWLEEFNIKLDNDIFETEDWVKFALNNSSSEGMEDIYVHSFRNCIKEAIEFDNGTTIKQEKGVEIKEYVNENFGILYCKIINNNDKAKPIWLLINGARVQRQRQYWELAKNNLLKQEIDFEPNEDSISRKAYRSYPKWTLNNNENLWFNIQKSKEESNLSLTREQIEFLNNFKFPHYINGQAGSGKSTMLYYLFANTYFYKYFEQIKGEIIFLTENETLLEHTQKSVYELLTNNPQFNLTSEEAEKSKKYFNSFKRFLIDILPEEEREKFPENKYLDFSKFKYLYENSNFQKSILEKYSAEEVWFTITTYIYGYDNNRFIKSENYEDISRDSRVIIPKEKFKGIENHVLPFYEKLINDEGYWDKLKIIRHINKNIEVNKKYSVIVCDEAQDFCRVELRFILRMSEFLDYDLSTTEQVPIVFAGDQNQTVNPTGFRQDEMESMLYEELKQIAKFEYNPKNNIYNPAFNYRSSQQVVTLANFIQYHRMRRLGVIQATLQEAKRPLLDININKNVFLSYEEIENNEELRNELIVKLKFKIFIIPVNSNEKNDFISKNTLLAQVNEAEIKTSVEAKGAEYEQVVLFGFGEYFLNTLEYIKEDKKDTNDKFKRSFFYNKLYVGITRAQTELIIIDSEYAKENFWKKIVTETEINFDSWNELNVHKNEIILYNPGSIKDKIYDSNENNAFENAKQDKKQGEYDKNPARLKVAANQFIKIGRKNEGFECLALAEELIENWVAAADLYLKSPNPNYEKASECLFKGRKFSDFESKIGNNLRSVEHDVRIAISRIMSGEIIGSKEINILKQNTTKFYEIINNVVWRSDIINQLISASKKIELIEQRRDFVQVLEKIAKSTDTALWGEIGNIRFDLRDYKEAIDAWDEIDFFDNNKKYTLAKIEFSITNNDIEKSIIWYDDLIKYENKQEINIYHKIVKLYIENIEYQFSMESIKIIFKALITVKNGNNEIIKVVQLIEKSYHSSLPDLIDYFNSLITSTIKDKNLLVFLIERWAKTIWKENKSNPEKKWLVKLNETYSEFSQKLDLVYKEFTIEELENLLEIPNNIILKPNFQFNNFRAINFRRFQNLSISNLGLYNLIVGDNNVGKTSLLEALLFDVRKEYFVQNLAYAYIQRNNLPVKSVDNEEKYNISTKFIADYVKKDAKPEEIEFILTENRNQWSFKIRTSLREEIIEKYQNIPNIDTTEFLSFVSDNLDTELIELPLIFKKLISTDNIKSPFIPFGKGFGKDLATVYYREIDIVKKERELFLENMKIFIPKIKRINADTENKTIDIEEEGFEKAAPLHQYGEGANKLFRILVQLTLQKGNKLLIDEIDAGIHFSHFADFWKIILTVAHRNKVQIFATTHNIECVKYFTQILKEVNFSEFQSDSKIITLRELPEGRIKAYTRSFNEFEYELENDFEIRGGDL